MSPKRTVRDKTGGPRERLRTEKRTEHLQTSAAEQCPEKKTARGFSLGKVERGKAENCKAEQNNARKAFHGGTTG